MSNLVFIGDLPSARAMEALREVHSGANVKNKTDKGGYIHNDSQSGPNNEAETGSDDLIHNDPTKEEGDGDEQDTRAGGGGGGGDRGEGIPGRCN